MVFNFQSAVILPGLPEGSRRCGISARSGPFPAAFDQDPASAEKNVSSAARREPEPLVGPHEIGSRSWRRCTSTAAARDPTRVLLVVLGLALSAAAIVMLGRSIDVGEAVRAVGRASIPWFLAANLLTIVVYWLRSLRWRSLLKPHASPTVGRLFSANMVGFLAINVLPARLGELVRPSRSPRSEASSTGGRARIGRRGADPDLVPGYFWALSLLFAPLPAWFKWSGYATIAIAVAVGQDLDLNAARGRSTD